MLASSTVASDAPVRASVACDCRNKFTPVLPLGFFGNAAIVVPFQCTSKALLLSESLRDTALRIRRALSAMYGPKLHSSLYSLTQKSNVTKGFKIGADISSSDWSALDWYGVASPEVVIPAKSMTLPGLIVLMGGPFEGLHVYVHTTAQQASIITNSNILHNIDKYK